MPTIYTLIDQLVAYGVDRKLIAPQDRVWAVNQLLDILQLDDYAPGPKPGKSPRFATHLLEQLCDWAAQHKRFEPDTLTRRDLFDTRLMGVLAKRPDEVISEFWTLHKTKGPQAATNRFYADAQALDYIRTARVAKNRRWKARTPYGNLDITINMSKPEKDPKDIAAALNAAASGYPACLLCKENEGYAGRVNHPARQTLRLIPLQLAPGTPWYLQYSPYVYYNEHCIVLSGKHEPMQLSKASFQRLLNFVELLPHYFVGSNADLPIVGGSILTHDHFQGGRYTFAMEKAPVEYAFKLKKFPRIKAGVVKWPMSVIRLNGPKEDLINAGDYILKKWRLYSDPQADILAFTGQTPHNTVTPIARKRGKTFELDLVLRNNRATAEFPMGLFHPHAEVHHIKKENIGLIEVMGLAVLPARLAAELAALEGPLIRRDLTAAENDPELAKHAPWAKELLKKHTFTAKNAAGILEKEVGAVFARVLEYAGVYKRTPEGNAAFKRFLASL